MKYTQGYIPKIKYWYGKLTSSNTPYEMNKALKSMNYFQNRHYDLYGKWIGVDDLIDKVEEEESTLATIEWDFEGAKKLVDTLQLSEDGVEALTYGV